MTRPTVLLLTIGACGLWILTGRYWLGTLAEQRRLVRLGRDTGAHAGEPGPPRSVRDRLDALTVRLRVGRSLRRRLDQADLRVSVLELAVATLVLAVGLWIVAGALLNELAGVLALLISPLIVATVLRTLARRRAVRMADQVPELAGALAAGAAAGLSLPVALHRAADDLPEPMAAQVRLALDSMAVGAATQESLQEIAVRMPSREMDLLLTTLSVQARGGGNLVRALNRLTHSLEQRREAQRESRSITAGSTATAYLLVAFGLGLVVMLQRAFPGSLDRTLDSRIGALAVAISVVLYVVGIVSVRRIAGRTQ